MELLPSQTRKTQLSAQLETRTNVNTQRMRTESRRSKLLAGSLAICAAAVSYGTRMANEPQEHPSTGIAKQDEQRVIAGVITRKKVKVQRLECFYEPWRRSIKPTGLTMHYTVVRPDSDAMSLCKFMKSNNVSVQYNVDKNGTATLFTRRPDIQTGHEKGANRYNIGIEISGRNEHDLLRRKAQYATVANLAIDIMRKYDISLAYTAPKCSPNGVQLGRNYGLHAHSESPCSLPPAVPARLAKIDPGDNYMKILRKDIARLAPDLSH